MQTPSKNEIAKLPRHEDRPGWPGADRTFVPPHLRKPIERDDDHDAQFVNHDLIGVVTIVIATAVLGLLIGWLFIQ